MPRSVSVSQHQSSWVSVGDKADAGYMPTQRPVDQGDDLKIGALPH